MNYVCEAGSSYIITAIADPQTCETSWRHAEKLQHRDSITLGGKIFTVTRESLGLEM